MPGLAINYCILNHRSIWNINGQDIFAWIKIYIEICNCKKVNKNEFKVLEFSYWNLIHLWVVRDLNS